MTKPLPDSARSTALFSRGRRTRRRSAWTASPGRTPSGAASAAGGRPRRRWRASVSPRRRRTTAASSNAASWRWRGTERRGARLASRLDVLRARQRHASPEGPHVSRAGRALGYGGLHARGEREGHEGQGSLGHLVSFGGRGRGVAPCRSAAGAQPRLRGQLLAQGTADSYLMLSTPGGQAAPGLTLHDLHRARPCATTGHLRSSSGRSGVRRGRRPATGDWARTCSTDHPSYLGPAFSGPRAVSEE